VRAGHVVVVIVVVVLPAAMHGAQGIRFYVLTRAARDSRVHRDRPETFRP
jgi:hypothetical protein